MVTIVLEKPRSFAQDAGFGGLFYIFCSKLLFRRMWPFLTNHHNMDTFSWFYPHQTWSSAVCSRPRKLSFASQFHLFPFASRMPFFWVQKSPGCLRPSTCTSDIDLCLNVDEQSETMEEEQQCVRPPKTLIRFPLEKNIGQMQRPAINIAFFVSRNSLLLEGVTRIVHRYGFLYGWQFNYQSSPGDKWSTNRQWIHQWNLKFVVIRSSILNFLQFLNNYYFGVEWELQFLVCFFCNVIIFVLFANYFSATKVPSCRLSPRRMSTLRKLRNVLQRTGFSSCFLVPSRTPPSFLTGCLTIQTCVLRLEFKPLRCFFAHI